MGVIQFDEGQVGPPGPAGPIGATGATGPTGALFPSTLNPGDYIQDAAAAKILENVGGVVSLTADVISRKFDERPYYFNQTAALGIHGGNMVASQWKTRAFTELNHDGTSPDMTLSASFFMTINTAGTYRFKISAPAYGVLNHQIHLVRDPDNAIFFKGSGERTSASSQSRSFIDGIVDIFTVPVDLKVLHWANTSVEFFGQGVAVAAALSTEVYMQATVTRLA